VRPRRPLGFVSLVALGINGVVGIGVFFAPQAVAADVPGWRGLLVYGVVAMVLVPVAIVFAKLARVFEQDGGPYLYARAAFGETAAFSVGWLTYVSALFGTSTVVVGLVKTIAVASGVQSRVAQAAMALALLAATSALLARGLRRSAWVWSTVTVAKILPMLALLAFALVYAPAGDMARSAGVQIQRQGMLSASLTVVFALQGFEIVPVPAAQVERSKWAVPRATIASLILPALLYLALHAACVRALPDLGAHPFALADAARQYGGARLYQAMIAAANVSALGITVGMLAMTPRYLAVLGAHGALGRGFGELSERAVPIRALAVTAAVVSVVVTSSIMWGSIANLFALSSISVIIQYGMTAAALFGLAMRGQRGLARADAWPAPLVVAACGLISIGAKKADLVVVVMMLGLGLAMRTLAGRWPGRRVRT
jgi:APA family basic amino acid/polyamine antiporter